ncbi:hypothetical protein GCM10017562_13050 [Streptomyces roseofulvus]
MTGPEPSQRSEPSPAEKGEQEQTGGTVTEGLSARVRVVAEQTVGGEGSADEGVGEGHEQDSAQGVRVHGPDAREQSGPD